jgi:hypothetical protein
VTCQWCVVSTHLKIVLIIRQKSGVDFNSKSFFKSEGFNVYCLVVSSIAWSFEFFTCAAAYYWHCGRIEYMVLSTAAGSCGSQSVLSTMDKWSNSVDSIPDHDPKQKAKMKLSYQTIEGLHMTGMEQFIAPNFCKDVLFTFTNIKRAIDISIKHVLANLAFCASNKISPLIPL